MEYVACDAVCIFSLARFAVAQDMLKPHEIISMDKGNLKYFACHSTNALSDGHVMLSGLSFFKAHITGNVFCVCLPRFI